MANALQTTPYALSPTDDVEESPSVLEKKTSLPSVFLWPFGLLLRFPFLSSAIIYSILAGSLAGIIRGSYRETTYLDIQTNKSGVALIGRSHRLDLTSQTLTIKWKISGCGAYNIWSTDACFLLNRAVDVYFNGASNPTFSYDPGLTDQMLILNSLNVFEVDHSIESHYPDIVPFDTYWFSSSAFAIDKATNKSVPVVSFTADETTDNFVVSTGIGLSAKSNFTYNPGTGPITVEVEPYWVQFGVNRSQLAQAFTMCLLVINWALAIGSIYITLLVVSRREKLDAAVLLLPVTIVLTIPSLRGLYVGSPPFGIFIDTFGFFLQMMTVAVCSMVLLYAVALPNRTPERRASGDNETSKLLGVTGEA